MKSIKFTSISPIEMKFEYKDMKFILEEGKIGVYGRHQAIRLYQLEGLKKAFIKCVGWITPDNYCGDQRACITTKPVTMESSKALAVDYLDNLLK